MNSLENESKFKSWRKRKSSTLIKQNKLISSPQVTTLKLGDGGDRILRGKKMALPFGY